MKIFCTLTSLVLFLAGPFSVIAQPRGHMPMGMNHPHQSSSQKRELKPAKLGVYKKTHFWTRSKRMMIKAPLVPITAGMARFEIQLANQKGGLLKKAKIIKASYEMPGMPMDLPEISVKPTHVGSFQLVFPVPIPGYWKIHLTLKSGGRIEKGTVKFVAK